MPTKKVTSFTLTGRFLVAGAVFLFVLLVAAAAVTNTMGIEARDRLTAAAAQTDTRAAAAIELDRLLGRAGFAGQLLSYAASDNAPAEDLTAMEAVLDDAQVAADQFTRFGTESFARRFGEIVRGRIAQGRLALASLATGEVNAAAIAVEYAGDLSAYDAAYSEFQVAEQRLQTREALQVLTLQRWITSLALGAAVFIMGVGALLLHLNIRRPLRQLAENLEGLMADEEDWSLPETDRADEVGMVARVADELRRTQLQAGRILTVGADGALRLRLEGASAEAVDTALQHITDAVSDLRGSAATLSQSSDGIAGQGREAMSRIEGALDETIAETAGRLGALTEAGEEVLKLAGELEGTRRSLASTEGDWRLEMTNLAETMCSELERLRATSEHLSESTATAGARVTHVSNELTDITAAWRGEQHALNNSSEQAREALTAKIETLEGQITTLDQALTHLQGLTDRAGPPIERAAGRITKAVDTFGDVGKTAHAATALMAKEADAARTARLSVMSEAEADRAHWQSERNALREQAAQMIAQMKETGARVEALAQGLESNAGGLPAQLEQLAGELTALSTQMQDFEGKGGAIANHLGTRLAAVQEVLGEAQSAFVDEANVLRGVTSDLTGMHVTFDKERRTVSDTVETLAASIARLDTQLQTINERVESPVDLSPVLGALRNEMGQTVTHLTRSFEDQALTSQRALSNAVYQLGEKIENQNGSFEHLIATGLLDLSDRLNSKITAQNEAAQNLVTVLGDVQAQLANIPSSTIEGEAHIVPQEDVAALVDPRFEKLDETAREMVFELRALAKTVAERETRTSPKLIEQIASMEEVQTRMGEAQQAMALALRDGLTSVSSRLRHADARGTRHQLDEVMETLVRHQDRLSTIMRDMSADMKTRIDGLSGQIARTGKSPMRKSLFGGTEPDAATTPADARVSQTPAPEENELSAIYDALRGLTEELKGLSTEEIANEGGMDDGSTDGQRNAS